MIINSTSTTISIVYAGQQTLAETLSSSLTYTSVAQFQNVAYRSSL